MIVCKRVHYSGQVQGVGFRYTAQQVAGQFAVAGYVKNLPGGDVELVAEGDAAVVDSFLQAIATQMAGYIQDRRLRDEPCSGFSGFRIRY
jgi:acylphosphatase